MEGSDEKGPLRSRLLEKRDNTSADLIRIAGDKIRKRLRKIREFREAQKIGAYYSIGSEIPTQDIIQELLSEGRDVLLPRVTNDTMEFKRISDFASLETGMFDIMEPREGCQTDNDLDVILVPTVAVSPAGTRLGYGRGYYDRFLAGNRTVAISLTLEKQIVRNIPRSKHDVPINWIVTEDQILRVP